jgi:hypothetical protein
MVVAETDLELVATMTAFMTRLYSNFLVLSHAHEKSFGQTGVDFDLESEDSALEVTDL